MRTGPAGTARARYITSLAAAEGAPAEVPDQAPADSHEQAQHQTGRRKQQTARKHVAPTDMHGAEEPRVKETLIYQSQPSSLTQLRPL